MKDFDNITGFRPFNNDDDVVAAIKGRFKELVENTDGQGQCFLRLLLEDNDFTIEINVIRILEMVRDMPECEDPEHVLEWTGLTNLSEIIELIEDTLFGLTKTRATAYEFSDRSVFWRSNEYGVLINRGEPITFPTSIQ